MATNTTNKAKDKNKNVTKTTPDANPLGERLTSGGSAAVKNYAAGGSGSSVGGSGSMNKAKDKDKTKTTTTKTDSNPLGDTKANTSAGAELLGEKNGNNTAGNNYTVGNYTSTMKNPALSSETAKTNYDNFVRDNTPGEFNYDDDLFQAAYNDIMSREDFSFDINTNALYNQYKDIYQKQGQMAMMDVMGQAAALSGGYGNSYAASAGMQAYQQSLDQLTEKVPELYQLAMQQYQLEGQNLQDKYNAGLGERNFAYNQHRDDVGDYQWGSQFYYDQYQDAVGNEQRVAEHELDVAGHNLDVAGHNASLDQWQQEFDYQKQRDAVADSQWQQTFDYQKQRDTVADGQWQQEFGLSREQFEHLKEMDSEQLKQWAQEHDLDVQQLQHLIEMDEWEMQQAGRSG